MRRGRPALASRAATSSSNSFVVPTTILRCLLLPSGPGSRQLNSQTSGPPCCSVRIMLPFCMDFPFCASNAEIAEQDLQAQFKHRLSMRKGKNRNKSRKVIAFLRRCPAVCGDDPAVFVDLTVSQAIARTVGAKRRPVNRFAQLLRQDQPILVWR